MIITPQQLSASMQCPLARAAKWVDSINVAMDKFEINTPLRVAHFLAQVGHESARLVYVREIASGKAYNGREDLGNTRKEALDIAKANDTTPGEFWKGHGLIQITGFANHRLCGIDLGVDAVNNPKILEQPTYAAQSAGWYWTKFKNLNPLADQDDIEAITRKVNGGLNGFSNRKLILSEAKRVLGI